MEKFPIPLRKYNSYSVKKQSLDRHFEKLSKRIDRFITWRVYRNSFRRIVIKGEPKKRTNNLSSTEKKYEGFLGTSTGRIEP